MSERTLTLKIKALRDDAQLPVYATSSAAGLDLFACTDEPVVLKTGERTAIPTGVAVALPEQHEAQIRPRSGLAAKHGVTVVNAPGTIDEDYRGEIKVLLINLGQDDYTIQAGDRIAQMVVSPISRVQPELTEELSETARGEGGFGSTGNK